MSIYLELKDVDIKGEVTAKGYEDHLRVETLGFSNKKDWQHQAAQGTVSTNMSSIVFSKYIDVASTGLMQASIKGDLIKTAKFKFTRDIGSKIKTYMEYELSDVYISEYALSTEPEADPLETISLEYKKITFSYVTHAIDGKPRSKQTVSHNRETNK